ncbi:MAG TPA: tetratricopeptide repeat protein [Edaphobacter sp.]
MMNRFSRASHLRLLAAAAVLAVVPVMSAQSSAPKGVSPQEQPVDRSSAYYHYGLAHMYEDMAVSAGRPDYATQAIEEYKLAMDADPNSTTLQDGLAELYFKLGRIREAVTSAQEQVKKNPNDVAAHDLLGKIYLRSLGDMQGQQSGQMLRLAIGEYEKLAELKPNDVETHLLLGQLYGLNHDSAKAESEFKAAQKIDSDSEEVVLNMYRLYTEQEDFVRAAEVLNSIPEDDRSARIDFALGATYDQLKKPKDAIAAYRRALDDDPGNIDSERGLATALLRDGQLDEASKVFNDIVTAEPQDAQSLIKIADIQRQQGHYDDALATLEKAKPLAQDSVELAYNEALVYDTLGRYDDAIRSLKTLLDGTTHSDGRYTEQEKSNRAIFLDRMGTIYREQNKTAEAVEVYRQMIPMGGDFAKSGYQGVIDSYRDAHQWKEATDAAAEAAKAMPKEQSVQLAYAAQLADTGKVEEGLTLAKAQISPAGNQKDDREVHLALANIYTRLKRWSDADKELSAGEALSQKPEEKLYVYFLRGILADRQKQYDAAEAQFRKALAVDPQNATILNYLGYMWADRGVKLNEALTMIRKAVELDPQNYAYLDSLGWAYYKTGQYALAEENIRKANERNVGDPTIHDHLGDVYEKTGKLKQAVLQWERSLTEYSRSLPADADPEDVTKVQRKLDSARVKLSKVNAGSVK